ARLAPARRAPVPAGWGAWPVAPHRVWRRATAAGLAKGVGVRAGDEFFNLYNHDFVRVAVAMPSVRVADPVFNGDQTLALMAEAAAQQAVLALFPEPGLSAYSCEHVFLPPALLDASQQALP